MGERAPRFRINVRADTDALVVAVAGELDMETAAELRPCLETALEAGDGHVVVDLGDVTFIDSSGIALLVAVRRAAIDGGRRLELLNIGPRALAVFELTGVTDTLVAGDRSA